MSLFSSWWEYCVLMCYFCASFPVPFPGTWHWQVEVSHGRSIDSTEINAMNQVLLGVYHLECWRLLVAGTVNFPGVGFDGQRKPSGKEMQLPMVERLAGAGKSEEMWAGHRHTWHTFGYICTCADICARVAWWYAFCHSFSKLDQTFHVTIYYINHFML